MKRKKIILVSILVILVCAITALGVTFGYYKQTKSGWCQNITATNVTFRLNGNPIETITDYNLGLVERGKEAEVDLEVLVRANVSFGAMARFNTTFTFNGEDNELARAIEVYLYQDGSYVYRGMLSDVDEMSGVLPINTPVNYHYKLVYSAAASDYYEGKSFSLKVTASSDIYRGETDNYYVSSYYSLMKAVAAGSAISGKTIVLTKDITLTSDGESDGVTFYYPVGIDLAGHTLSIGEGANITVNAETASKVKIKNSNPHLGEITGDGRIIYNLPTSAAESDCLLIGDELAACYDHIVVNNAVFSAVADEMESQLADIMTTVLKVGSEIDFTKGLKYYFSSVYPANKRFTLTPPTNGDTFDTSVLTAKNAQNTSYAVSDTYAVPKTAIRNVSFALASATGSSYTLLPAFKIRGVSVDAIADYFLSLIPDEITGSVFFPAYDSSSDSTLTWVTDNSIISTNGEYLPNGYMDLNSWADTVVRIGVLVDNAGMNEAATKNVTVRILSAEERTNLIYDYRQIVLSDVGVNASIYDEYVNAEFADKADLYSISASFVDSDQNINNVGLPYLELSSGTNGAIITVLRKPSGNRSVSVDVNLVFTYKNERANGDAEYTSYSVKKTITVVGYSETTELSEPTRFLQQNFDANDYVSGKGYTFSARAYSTQGANLDYFIPAAYASYVFVENDVYQKAAEGPFVKKDEKYYFFDSRYSLIDGEYVSDLEGGYIAVGNDYLDVSDAFANGETYYRNSIIRILPAKVPSAEETKVTVRAQIWTEKDSNGNKIYYTQNGQTIVYNLFLMVRGIYHNIPSEIASYALYAKLLSVFDIDGDGWLQITEANANWNDSRIYSQLSSTSIGSVEYRYLDLSSQNITTLKGLEYFTGAIGYDLTGNEFIDISQLSALYSLKYLNLSENDVADITALSYLDSLEVLILRNMPISTIEPIRYLPAIKKLDLYHDEYIETYEYIADYKNLIYLDIRQKSENSTLHPTSYYAALIYDANRANGITIYRTGNVIWTPQNTEIVAAKVLSELLVIGEVYTTLNIPNTYYYEYTVAGQRYRKNYNISYSVSDSNSLNYLSFNTNSQGKTIGYTINTPIVNRDIGIMVVVTEQGSSDAVALSRTFHVTLLQSQAAEDAVYIETEPGVFSSAASVVPDTALLSLLFSIFNTHTDGYVSGSTEYTEANTISQIELNTLDTDSSGYPLEFSVADIKSLKGLSVFKDAIGFPLDLRGKTLENSDISELASMINVPSIRLSGQSYDFSQISSYTEEDGVAVIEGLTGLSSLYVYGSFNLDNDDTLAGLYQVYLSNPAITIYKDSDTDAWDPYGDKLRKYAQKLPSAFIFIDLNDTANYYGGEATDYLINFYGVKTIPFTLDIAHATFIGTQTSLFTHTSTGVRYSTLAGYSDVIYDKVVLSGTDGISTISSIHYVELKFDFNHKINVIDYPEKAGNIGLDVIFPGRTVRSAVMTRLANLFSSQASASSMSGIGSGYFKDGNNYYITMATLMGLPFTSTLQIDGTYTDVIGASAIQGLQYLPITEVEITRDCNLGDGRYIYNINTLYVTYSGIDFSEIRSDLPNLKTLRIGYSANKELRDNRYTVLFDNSTGTPYYNLKHLINLETFILLSSQTYEWDGLEGLVGIDISTFYIYATGAGGVYRPFSNRNANYATTEAIVRRIYAESHALVKDYRIGAENDPFDNNFKYTGAWTDPETGVTELTVDAIKEYKDFASQIIDLGVKIDGKDYVSMSDAIVENGKTIILPSTTYANFGTVTAESDAFKRRFSVSWTLYGINSATALSMFGLSGLADAKATQIGFENLDCCTISAPALYADRTITVASPTRDYYLLFVGTIGGGYVDESGNYTAFGSSSGINSYSFVYPVLVRGTSIASGSADITYKTEGTDNSKVITSEYVYTETTGNISASYLSYRAIKDPALRYATYLITAAQPYSTVGVGSFAKRGEMLISAKVGGVVSAAGVTRIKGISITMSEVKASYFTSGLSGEHSIVSNDTSILFSSFGKNLVSTYVYTLSGAEYFLSLRDISVKDSILSDIDALSYFSSWEQRCIKYTSNVYGEPCGLRTIDFNRNALTSLDALQGLSTLTSVNAEYNFIQDLDKDGEFVLKASMNTLTSLVLNGNACLSDTDVLLIKDAAAEQGSIALSVLGLSGTSCDFSSSALSLLGEVAAYANGGTLNLTMSGGTSGISASSVRAFFDDVLNTAGSSNANDMRIAGYINSGYMMNEPFYTSVTTTGGTSYSLSLLNGDMLLTSNGAASGTLLALPALTNKFTATTVIIRIQSASNAVFSAEYTITLQDSAGSAPNLYPVYIDGVRVYQSSFDPALWLWLMQNVGDLTTVNGENGYKYTSLDTYIFESEIGLRSLEGFQFFKNCRTLKVSSQRYLTELWKSSVGITTLTLGKIPIGAEGLTGLRFARSLTTLNLAELECVDYLSEVTYVNEGSGVTSTLAEIILSSLTSLKKLYVSNAYNFGVYGDTAQENLIAYADSDSYLFNIDTGSNARKFSSFTYADFMHATLLFGGNNHIAFTNAMLPYLTYSFATDSHMRYCRDVTGTEVDDPVSISALTTAASAAALFTTQNGRGILPSILYQQGIEDIGVKFYLPSVLNIGGTPFTFAWSMRTGNPDYISADTNIFEINSEKWNVNKETSIALSYTLTSPNGRVLSTGTRVMEIRLSESSYEQSNFKLPMYYVEMPDGNGGTYLEPAVTYFKSTRLLYYLFNPTNNANASSAIYKITSSNYTSFGLTQNEIGKYYLSYYDRLLITSLSFPNEGITSLSGIELFSNLKEFSFINTSEIGAFISLDALTNLRLTSFQYYNRASDKSYAVQDFSPLFNSRDTLTTFIYRSTKFSAIDDLSFLMSFGEQLTLIDIGSADVKNDDYNKTLGYRYLVNWFAVNRPNTVFYYNGVQYQSNDSDDLNGMNVLSNLNTEDTGVDYKSEFELCFNDNAVQSGITQSGTVPTVINMGGEFYPIRWKSFSSFASFGSLIYQGATVSVYVNGSVKTFAEGDPITDEEFEVLLASHAFLQNYVMKKCNVTQTLSIIDADKNILKNSYLIMRVNVGGYDYERVLTFNCSQSKVYPQIFLMEGQGSMLMPLDGDTSYSGWSLLNDEGVKCSSYSGVNLAEFTAGGVTRQVLIIEDPNSAISGKIILVATENGIDKEYVLYHSFDLKDLSEFINGASRSKYAIDYTIALKLTSVVIDYKAFIINCLEFSFNDFNSNDYSDENYATITSIYNEAVSLINSAETKSEIDEIYSNALQNMAAVKKMALVTYDWSEVCSGSGVPQNEVHEQDEVFTLPLRDDYVVYDSNNCELSGWRVNGTAYPFGASITLPFGVITIKPVFILPKYYIVPTAKAASYDVYGRELVSGDYQYDGKSYSYALLNAQFMRADLNSSTSFTLVKEVRSSGQVVTVLSITTGSDVVEHGRYSLYFDESRFERGDESPYNFIHHNFSFTLMGTNAPNIAWTKPEEDYPLHYDAERGFYYVTVTTTSNDAQFKICACLAGHTTQSSPGNGTDYLAVSYDGVHPQNYNFMPGTKGTWTIYFTPDYIGFADSGISGSSFYSDHGTTGAYFDITNSGGFKCDNKQVTSTTSAIAIFGGTYTATADEASAIFTKGA